MRLLSIAIAFTLATACWADTFWLKGGKVIHGTYLGGTARQVKVQVGDEIQTLDVSDVVQIYFGDGMPSIGPTGGVYRAPSERRDEPPQEAAAPSPSFGMTLPAGTNFVIRTIDAVDSETAQVGQNFAGSLDEAVVDPSGNTIIPRGADVTMKLVDSKESGKIAGRTELALALMAVRVNGQMVDINTQTVKEESSSRAGRSAKTIGGGAVAGAVLGGILGGGKGAAIGMGAGGAAGAGVELATKGQRVRVPSETRLTFVLDNPVRL